MTPTLVRHEAAHTGAERTADPASGTRARARARDWAEIQERMLAPLYDAVYDRLDVGPGTRLLGLDCGSGLALVMAARRGARVSGVDRDARRLDLARERLDPNGAGAALGARPAEGGPWLACGGPQALGGAPGEVDLVTAFHPAGCASGVADRAADLARAVRPAGRGSLVVLGGWGPEERCAVADVVRVADRIVATALGDDRPASVRPAWAPGGRDELEELAAEVGLRPDGSGRVGCPFGYGDVPSAVRGMLSTGLFDGATELVGAEQVEKELAESLHAHRRADGTVWMPNVFRYLVARVD